jgi:hypothetical protein
MKVSEPELSDLIVPDADVIAQQIAFSRKQLKLAPAVADLSRVIGDITLTDTIKGASTLTITILDENWELLDSGFFDADKNGKLDAIEINYPVSSKAWWRLTMCSPTAMQKVEMTFMERAAVLLMDKKEPMKASRGSTTRAQFLKRMCDSVKKHPITFYCHELTKKQQIGSQSERDKETKARDDQGRHDGKHGGIHESDEIRIQGALADKDQIKNINIAMDVADQLGASQRAVQAMCCAAIGESNFRCIMNTQGSGYGGVFQGDVSHQHNWFKKTDTDRQAHYFLKGGLGYQGGGAIALADAHPQWGPGLIAVTVEGSRSNFTSDEKAEHHYGQWRQEANKIIEAFGGGFGGTTYRQQFNFQVGGQDNPGENYWDACQRLAEEVRWEFFADGDLIYFDSDMTLIQQGAIAVISRDDFAVVDWSFDWDARHIATEMRLSLITGPVGGPFSFARAGEVLKLVGFGPASTGSTVKASKNTPSRPGFWLISEISWSRVSQVGEYTLVQPKKPKSEPLSELTERSDSDTAAGGSLYTACKHISDQDRPYVYGGGHKLFRSIQPNEGLDCSSSCSLALYRADMFDGTSAITSGAFSHWGAAGRGSDFTVWYNEGHVFIQSEGGRRWRFDTGGPGGGHGPKLRLQHRPTDGFHPRHWTG